ncbi:MAG: hypothetical protein KatS3mg043_1601 [Rhodothermaceae bacterium]|nr:MAG: hypothetical protein KatS3mg043_1601 [Rhodothermaceae bacterium]
MDGMAHCGETSHGTRSPPSAAMTRFTYPVSKANSCWNRIVTTTPETTTGRKYTVRKKARPFSRWFNSSAKNSATAICRGMWMARKMPVLSRARKNRSSRNSRAKFFSPANSIGVMMSQRWKTSTKANSSG